MINIYEKGALYLKNHDSLNKEILLSINEFNRDTFIIESDGNLLFRKDSKLYFEGNDKDKILEEAFYMNLNVSYKKYERALFAGGCFWCMANPYYNLDGVKHVFSGYAGGSFLNPTYEMVKSKKTGHLETILIVYDKEKISYETLLKMYFESIDPFDKDGQFIDRGSNYKTAVFIKNKEAENAFDAIKLDIESRYHKKVEVMKKEDVCFFKAEEYHQGFSLKNRKKFLEEEKISLRDEFNFISLKRNVLITNDDSFGEEGIKILEDALAPFANVYVLAPKKAMSGASHSFSFGPFNTFKVDDFHYILDSSPVDCVRVAKTLFNTSFDLVISGVNAGLNLGTDVIYSGTVGAAREASILGIPGIAMSADAKSFDMVRASLPKVLDLIFKNHLYLKYHLLNINFPKGTFKGIKVARLGKKIFKTNFKLESGIIKTVSEDLILDDNEDTDVFLESKGYITITPLSLDQTKMNELEMLKNDIL